MNTNSTFQEDTNQFQIEQLIHQYKQNPQTISKWQLLNEISKYPNRNKLYEKAMGPSHHSTALKKRRMTQQMKQHLTNEIIKSCALTNRSSNKKETFEKVLENTETIQREVNTFISMIRELKRPETITTKSQIDGGFTSLIDSYVSSNYSDDSNENNSTESVENDHEKTESADDFE